MMKGGNLAQLSQRAFLIKEVVNNLRNEVSHLKTTLLKDSYDQEAKYLLSENEKLQREVEQWVNKLVSVEMCRGVQQVPLPNRSVQLQNVVVKKNESTPVQPEPKTVSDKPPEPKRAKQKQSDQEKPEKKSKVDKQTPVSDDNKPVDVSRLDLRIGKIVAVEKHKDADSLYVEQVDLGEDKPRTVVSGLVKHVPIEEMLNRIVVLLCNLKPAKMRGVMSEAMVMCASTPEKVEILTPPEGSIPGDRISFEGYVGEPDTVLNPKKKIFEQVAPDLKTDANCVATYKGVPFSIPGKGLVKAYSLANVQIK